MGSIKQDDEEKLNKTTAARLIVTKDYFEFMVYVILNCYLFWIHFVVCFSVKCGNCIKNSAAYVRGRNGGEEKTNSTAACQMDSYTIEPAKTERQSG